MRMPRPFLDVRCCFFVVAFVRGEGGSFLYFAAFNGKIMMVSARGNHEGSRTTDTENFAMLCLGYALNHLTGHRISLDGKQTLAKSTPGHRSEFIRQWLAD